MPEVIAVRGGLRMARVPEAAPHLRGWVVATLVGAGLLLGAGATFAAESAAREPGPAAQALHKLLDEEWEWRLREFPELATTTGDHRYDDRVGDHSGAAVAARRQHHLGVLKAVQAIDRGQLVGEDRVSLDILAFTSDLDVRTDRLLLEIAGGRDVAWAAEDSPLRVNQMAGPQFYLPQLVRATRFRTEADYRNYITRLGRLPQGFVDLRTQLEQGRAAGLIPPHASLERLPGQFGPLLEKDLAKNPLYEPLRKMPEEFAVPLREALQKAAGEAITGKVVPALHELRDYLASTWVPAAPLATGAGSLPHGAELYRLMLERYNTTRMSAGEIHDLGLREVARIDAEMLAVKKESGFEGSMEEFRKFLRTDPRFVFHSAEEELAAFRDIAKRVDPLLPNLFVELPRLPYGIRAMSPEEGNNAPHYISGALDGSRAGYFEANVNNLAAWPRWTMEVLFLHEAVPGHHLQIARAQEIPSLPKWRRAYNNSGFAEGWGLYAEGLGKPLGLYTDVYSRFGRLVMDAHRASRLVVDTGLHSMGWTREQAIAYLIEHAQLERGFAEAEVDRYLVWPGQATAYKVGEQRILALRENARTALGAKFDLRRFHNAVLDHGALPLPVLESSIGEWIAAEKTRAD